ncbi:putative MscS family protein [Phycisphaera mikurensis NBRC 102666]|uniref:Putative MscS family protein n=2 Tax=Phycisphaera TaxID=666508 RepID=I0IDS9_PHYMF|nr:putative MscS family protein [Phycisphaera mikurensis NBRC 102666]
MGPIASGVDALIPETGVKGVDDSTETLARSIGGMVDTGIAYLPQVVIALLVVVATFFLVGIAGRVSRWLARRAHLRESLADLVRLAIRTLVWFVGLMLAAVIVFPGFGVGNLIATTGLLSIALGFAFQDIFENAFAGVLILWRFPLEIGDFIEVPSVDVMGKVEDIEIRMTQIRLTTGELVLMPNSTIYKNVVKVLTNRAKRRITVPCGIAYGEDVAEGRRVMHDAAAGCASVDTGGGHGVEVYAQAFGASSIDFEITWWTGATPLEQRRSRDEVVEAVKAALDAAGIEIPYPYRTLTFSRNEPDILEAVAQRATGGGDAGG